MNLTQTVSKILNREITEQEAMVFARDQFGTLQTYMRQKEKPTLDKIIDNKVNQLLSLSDEFIFPAYYSHTNKTMWKISNVYTKYGGETLVLCGVDEGIEKAIGLAIECISKAKEKFYAEE